MRPALLQDNGRDTAKEKVLNKNAVMCDAAYIECNSWASHCI
jgi:hypothetical protein